MPNLQETRLSIALAPAKPGAAAQFGAPLVETTQLKKGRAEEHLQNLDTGAIGRRFQTFRVTAIKTVEGEEAIAKLFVAFEAFGDNSVAGGGGIGAELFAGGKLLAKFASTGLFLPYANSWQQNNFVFDLSLEDFAAADRLDFVAPAEAVKVIAA